MSEYRVCVSLAHNDGSTSHRVYERGSMTLSREAFNAFALGNMLALVETGYTDTLAFASAQQGTSFPLVTTAIGIETIDDANTYEDVCERFIGRYCA